MAYVSRSLLAASLISVDDTEPTPSADVEELVSGQVLGDVGDQFGVHPTDLVIAASVHVVRVRRNKDV
jgi:hypothetical protein